MVGPEPISISWSKLPPVTIADHCPVHSCSFFAALSMFTGNFHRPAPQRSKDKDSSYFNIYFYISL